MCDVLGTWNMNARRKEQCVFSAAPDSHFVGVGVGCPLFHPIYGAFALIRAVFLFACGLEPYATNHVHSSIQPETGARFGRFYDASFDCFELMRDVKVC